MQKSIYSKPKLVKAKQGWYVYFRYNRKKKVYKFDLNRIENLKERERKFKVLADELQKKLETGWNPFADVQVLNNQTYFLEALDFGYGKKNLSKKTLSGYKTTLKIIKQATIDLMLDHLDIKDVRRAHIRTILEKARDTHNWSNKSYNKNLTYLSAIMSELIDWDILEYNPAHKIKKLPETESKANRTATEKEHLKIKNHLKDYHPNFYDYVVMLYHTGIRPKELLQVKLNMIDLENREIHLPPSITKTGKKYRNVIISDELFLILSKRNLDNYPQNYYLFGSFRESGKGNIGKHEDFIIGSTAITRDTATKRWQRIIKKGLGINVNLYSYKHKGGDDKLLAGVDLDTIRNQLGHQDKRMTKRYVKEITGVYKNDIIKNSPKF